MFTLTLMVIAIVMRPITCKQSCLEYVQQQLLESQRDGGAEIDLLPILTSLVMSRRCCFLFALLRPFLFFSAIATWCIL